MNTIPVCRLIFLVGLWLTSIPCAWAEAAKNLPPQVFVIVHGAWGGGWDWKNVASILAADGHTVYRPTLTGLGERAHLARPDIGLSTHVKDIVNVILYEDLHDVVLVGHSYGGMVITGVLDEIPDRIRHVVYLDAFVPEDGESANDYWRILGRAPLAERNGTVRSGPFTIEVENGFMIFAGADLSRPPPSEVRQSLKTWTEPVSFKNPAARKLPASLVWFIEPGDTRTLVGSPLESLIPRFAARGARNLYLESDHLAERTHPRELAVMLEHIAAGDARSYEQ
jgi:pimeloyl-ACP methyl ester carboxylesterase